MTPIEEIDCFTFPNNSNVVLPNEALPNSIFIIDDMTCDKKDTISSFLRWVDTRERRLFLFQTYAKILKIKKYLIRDNANLFILFKQNGTNLKHVYNNHVNTDMSCEDFCELCRYC